MKEGDTVRRVNRHDVVGIVVRGSTTVDTKRFVSVQWSDRQKPMLMGVCDLERV